MPAYGFSKNERVRSEPMINALFAKGNFSLYATPFRFNWIRIAENNMPCQVLIVSSKKKLKRSVDRNRQKRQLRELYRLNKHELLPVLAELKHNIALAVVYTGAEPLDVVKHGPQFIKALQRIALAVKKDHTSTIRPAH